MKWKIVRSALACGLLAGAAHAQESQPPAWADERGVRLEAITKLPASYPKDVPLPQGARPVAAADRPQGLVVLFRGVGKAEPLRAAYEEGLAKRGWRIEGADRIGDEQGLFAVQGERTLSILLRESGPELRIQLAHVPKTPPPVAPTPK